LWTKPIRLIGPLGVDRGERSGKVELHWGKWIKKEE
jgi:hypothetical protein